MIASRPWVRPVATWVLFAAVATALDGPVGALVAVVVAAVLLARLPRQVLGGLGVLCLLGVPIAVVARGIPSPEDVSPFFVAGSLWPHHLMFAGLSLVCTDALLHWVEQRRAPAAGAGAGAAAPTRIRRRDAPEPVGLLPDAARWGIVAATAVAALVIAVAVWGT